MKTHKDLDAWKFSVDLVTLIYELTRDFPKDEIFGLTNQIRRASTSVVLNITEGCSRKSEIERKRYFEISNSFSITSKEQKRLVKKSQKK